MLWPSPLFHTHTHIPSHTPSASRSDISSLSFLLHFCPVLLPSHSPLLLRSISSDSRLSATLTNTYYVQSAHVCEHPASPSLNVCSYNASIQNRYESMYQASRCLVIFFTTLNHYLFFFFSTFLSYSTSATLSLCAEQMSCSRPTWRCRHILQLLLSAGHP